MIITFLISKYHFQVYHLLFTSLSETFSAGRSRRFTFIIQSGKYLFLNRMNLRMIDVFTGILIVDSYFKNLFTGVK
jgi:hypothetical protein